MDITKKKCIKCGVPQEIGAFYTHPHMADGHLNKCKECCRKDSIANRIKNRDFYREYDRQRGCRSNNKYRKPGTSNCARDLEKQPCEICGYNGYVEAHHEDYDKPKEVTWLCYQHHQALHGKCIF